LASLKTTAEERALKNLGCDSKTFKRVSRETLMFLKEKRTKQKHLQEIRPKRALPVLGFADERKRAFRAPHLKGL